MTITYNDLLEKRVEVERNYAQCVGELIESADKLVEEYRESLSYHGENKHAIAIIGDSSSSHCQGIRLTPEHMGEDNRLNFTILTDLSLPHGESYWVKVPIQLFKYQGKVAMVIAGEEHILPFIIPTDNSAYSYHQACIAIKQKVLAIITAKIVD